MSGHTIRLRGPWELSQPHAQGQVPRRIKFPAKWSESQPHFWGSARLSRRFGCPSGLTSTDRVWLVIDACQPLLAVSLAGRQLQSLSPAQGRLRFDITPLLEPQNQLVVELERAGDDGQPSGGEPAADRETVLGEVWLEIVAGTV